MITVTFVRHGESEDNLVWRSSCRAGVTRVGNHLNSQKNIWAGWKDAPLSELGRRQAAAAGRVFSKTHFDYVYVSPSLRAHDTGKAIHSLQPHNPPFTINPNLREQHWGIAEGYEWVVERPLGTETLQELYDRKIFPIFHGREDKFPEGESAEDLARRTEQALRECVLPHLHEDGANIAIASHGKCIFELSRALLRLDPDSKRYGLLGGLMNTAWTRAEVSLKENHSGPIDVVNPPLLNVVMTDIGRKDHLADVAIAQETAADATQSLKQQFFGGNKL